MFCGLGNCGKDSPHRMLIKTMGEDNGRVKKFSHFHFSTFTCKECQSSQCGKVFSLSLFHFHLQIMSIKSMWERQDESEKAAQVTPLLLKIFSFTGLPYNLKWKIFYWHCQSYNDISEVTIRKTSVSIFIPKYYVVLSKL